MAYVPRVYLPDCRGAGTVVLSPEQSRRLSEVMRVRAGDAACVFNGNGAEWRANVASVAKNAVTVAVGEVVRQEEAPKPAIELCFPLIRANRIDWLIEKAVECGVDAFQPANFEHSVRGEAPSPNRAERWQRIVIEAAEQSGRLYLPAFRDAASFADIVRAPTPLIVADRSGELWPALRSGLAGLEAVTIVIGPEGGLSVTELEGARAAGASIVSLGSNTLRAETAAVVAIALLRAFPPR